MSNAYDHIICNLAGMIDPALLKALIHVESSFDPNKIGRDGERGLTQIMRETAYDYGINFDQLFDPQYSIVAGASILSHLIDKYGLTGGLIAYNAGEGPLVTTRFRRGYEQGELYAAKVRTLYYQYQRELSCFERRSDVPAEYLEDPNFYAEAPLVEDLTPEAMVAMALIGVGFWAVTA